MEPEQLPPSEDLKKYNAGLDGDEKKVIKEAKKRNEISPDKTTTKCLHKTH